MSLYQLRRCVFDYLRAGEVSSGAAPDFDVSRYDLTDEERKSFESKNIAALADGLSSGAAKWPLPGDRV